MIASRLVCPLPFPLPDSPHPAAVPRRHPPNGPPPQVRRDSALRDAAAALSARAERVRSGAEASSSFRVFPSFAEPAAGGAAVEGGEGHGLTKEFFQLVRGPENKALSSSCFASLHATAAHPRCGGARPEGS